MNIIEQNVEWLNATNHIGEALELAARTCTNTTRLMTAGSYDPEFLKNSIMKRKHYSVLEHASLTFRLTTTRAIANRIVRHRVAAYCQESMRYVKLNRKDGGVPVIKPHNFDSWDNTSQAIWHQSVCCSETDYEMLLLHGIKAEDARGVLPLDTATVLIATWNLRELFHILYHPVSGRLTNKHAQPQTRELFGKLEDVLKNDLPFVYELAQIYKENENPTPTAN
jgi:thymidylate synthase (FAD)